jgi:hypothetical protein
MRFTVLPRRTLSLDPRQVFMLFAAAALTTATLIAQSPVAATDAQQLAPGVSYQALDVDTARGTARAHVIEVDLWQPAVRVDLLYPGVVADRKPVSEMADEQHAIAAVNGDFFNISATQPGVVPTGASVGPAVASLIPLKAAVPTRQRFGPSLPAGDTVEDVIGVGVDRVGRLGRLVLAGDVLTTNGRLELRGLNQYAIAENGIGAFDARWGSVSRKRASCGNDTRREDPCSNNVHEVTIRRGRVEQVSDEAGEGRIPDDTIVLLGRETGADELRQLQVGAPVVVRPFFTSTDHVPFRFAVGGQPIVRDGAAVTGLDNVTAATRSAAGIGEHGRRLFLLALDRHAAGMTYAELATLLLSVGASFAVNLDGGGSSTLVARTSSEPHVTIKNLVPGDVERPVPNGIAILTAH